MSEELMWLRVAVTIASVALVAWMTRDQMRLGEMTTGKWCLVPLMLLVTAGPAWIIL